MLIVALVGITIGLVLVYSLGAYVEKRSLQGTHVTPDDVIRSVYARAMLSASYTIHKNMTKQKVLMRTKQRALLKCRARTICGPLLAPLDGDPFSRSQRFVLAFLTVLCTLFFQVLFFPVLSKLICSKNATSGEQSCVQCICPSNYVCMHSSCRGACRDVLSNAPHACGPSDCWREAPQIQGAHEHH